MKDIFSYMVVIQSTNIFPLGSGPSDPKKARLPMILWKKITSRSKNLLVTSWFLQFYTSKEEMAKSDGRTSARTINSSTKMYQTIQTLPRCQYCNALFHIQHEMNTISHTNASLCYSGIQHLTIHQSSIIKKKKRLAHTSKFQKNGHKYWKQRWHRRLSFYCW